MKYTVCFGYNLPELEAAVNARLAENWQPCGGVCCIRFSDSDYPFYYQAMTWNGNE